MDKAQEFEAQLDAALDTRPVIELAKGVLVGTRCETPEQAFAELRYASQTHNVKLNALAGALVDVAAGRDCDDDRLQSVIWQEWGRLLPQC